ncbi:hypothetical protein L1987_18273 [Smallanthus sonchifolius]|uniref:Uncharacterized protein n=1 Tax=Smallanthus sonchifolius TaxID=185202 RepID=A0ACB9IZM9_9ASTR|nr:hypothetical protein L1987_18273 [Smallanthus sonchifolius]
MMSAGSNESGIGGGDSDEPMSPADSALEHEALIGSFHQTTGGLHTLVNHLSKWIVLVTYSGFILQRHDAFTFWAALGCVSNVILSLTLKRSLNQDRPVSGLSSGPGMPSSHAQTLFYTIILVILTFMASSGATISYYWSSGCGYGCGVRIFGHMDSGMGRSCS